MKALDLPGRGGRAHRGVPVGDAVLAADAVEHDLHGLGTEASGEHLAVVGEDLVGDPVAAKRRREDLAHGLRDGPSHEAGSHAEPAVVVDPGENLELGPVIEENPSHDVHLPQLHRSLPLPAAVLVSALAPTTQLDQPVAFEAAVDRRAGWNGHDPIPSELVLDPARAPAGVLPTHLADEGFGLGTDL